MHTKLDNFNHISKIFKQLGLIHLFDKSSSIISKSRYLDIKTQSQLFLSKYLDEEPLPKKNLFRVNSLESLRIFPSITPAGIYLFKVNNRNARKCQNKVRNMFKLTIKTPERRQFVLVSLLLILNIFHILFQCFYY